MLTSLRGSLFLVFLNYHNHFVYGVYLLHQVNYLKKMKIFLLVYFVLLLNLGYAQTKWQPEQLQKANTAQNISYLTQDEKDIVLHINLARLYPKQFMMYELNYNKDTIKTLDSYEKTLYKTLKKMKTLPALQFDEILYQSAKCLADEQSATGKIGHQRSNKCRDKYSTGENCNYGSWTGSGHVIQLLIDRGISSLGHRKNILDKGFTKIGTYISTHPKYSYVAVIDFL